MKRRAHSSSGAGPTAAKVKKDVPLVRRAGPYLLGEEDTYTYSSNSEEYSPTLCGFGQKLLGVEPSLVRLQKTTVVEHGNVEIFHFSRLFLSGL